jgi:hypothetical protein
MHSTDNADPATTAPTPSEEHRTEADDSLSIAYIRHRRIDEMLDVIRYCLEGLSVGFDRWNEEHVKGPGFYIAIVSGTSVEAYADPMGTNAWPTEICRHVTEDINAFYGAASRVAFEADGAVIASIDGVIQRPMVRLKDPSRADLEARTDEPISYADWMGSRHMSALDTSVREDVVATVTLSEETGRVTVFSDGRFETVEREAIGGRWRVQS